MKLRSEIKENNGGVRNTTALTVFSKAKPLILGIMLFVSVSCDKPWKRTNELSRERAAGEVAKIMLGRPSDCTKKARIYFEAGMDEEVAKLAETCIGRYRSGTENLDWKNEAVEIYRKAEILEKLGDYYMGKSNYEDAYRIYNELGLEKKAFRAMEFQGSLRQRRSGGLPEPIYNNPQAQF